MTWKPFSNMNALERREFMKSLAGFLALPAVPEALRYACLDWTGGTAYAQAMPGQPDYFLEVNFRDQWDFGTAFVAPSIAQAWDGLPKTGDQGIAVESRPQAGGVGSHHLTAEAMEIKNHLADVAVMELGELPIGGIHGHEASDALRSPGRSRTGGAGRKDMATVDLRPGNRVGGNEVHHSSTPTPAILHNHYVRSTGLQVQNGALLRSRIRPNTHTFYHFEADLQNAQLDRFSDQETLLNRFSDVPPPTPTTLNRYKSQIVEMISQIDAKYLENLPEDKGRQEHLAALSGIESPPPVMSTDLSLSSAEQTFWTSGIPGQFECAGDNADACRAKEGTMNLGEMFAYVAKLFTRNVVRTAAIDFDFYDVHTARTPLVLNTQATQTAVPLARFIDTLKRAGIWDRTIVAMYTLDGSRSPHRRSTGYRTKNSVILAGGKIKGDYYGDIEMANNQIRYKRPDDNGRPIANGVDGGDNRVPAKDVYATVAAAAGIPAATWGSFPDVAGANILSYMLK